MDFALNSTRWRVGGTLMGALVGFFVTVWRGYRLFGKTFGVYEKAASARSARESASIKSWGDIASIGDQ